jgi:hypothetical protein
MDINVLVKKAATRIHMASKRRQHYPGEFVNPKCLCLNGSAKENFNLVTNVAKVNCPMCLKIIALAEQRGIDRRDAAVEVIRDEIARGEALWQAEQAKKEQ